MVYGVDDPANTTFQITDTKLYCPLATLSTEDRNKLLEQLQSGFKRIIRWKKIENLFQSIILN